MLVVTPSQFPKSALPSGAAMVGTTPPIVRGNRTPTAGAVITQRLCNESRRGVAGRKGLFEVILNAGGDQNLVVRLGLERNLRGEGVGGAPTIVSQGGSFAVAEVVSGELHRAAARSARTGGRSEALDSL